MTGKLFEPSNRHKSEQTEILYARYEWWITINNFMAAVMFIIGSFMFLSEQWTYTGTWFFIVGSFCFALSPSLRLFRAYRLAKARSFDVLADDYQAENPKLN